MKTERIDIKKIEPDPENPRQSFDESDIAALGANMKSIGQQVPVIVYPRDEMFRLADGERRFRGALSTGIPDLLAIVMPQKPDAAALRIMQLSVEAHKVAHSPMERSDLLFKIQQETGWGVAEIAKRLHLSQSLVSKLLSFQKLSDHVRELVHTGRLDIEKAYMVASADADRQSGLIEDLTGLSREQARARLRNSDATQPKAKRAVFALPDGISITVQGLEVTLAEVLEHLLQATKEIKRGLMQGLDITTQQRVMKDKAK